MLKNIVAIERDGLDVRAMVITFDVPSKEFDIVAAVKAAATDYCMTEDGAKVYEYNCRQFNWADFEANVPNEFCEKYGFKKVDSLLGNLEVDWDEHLVDDSVLDDRKTEQARRN